MNVEFFSVYDQAAHRYMDPFCAPTIEFALRGFREACEKDGHQFNKYPEDYVLYQCGAFDAEKGIVTGLEPLVKIAMAVNFAFEKDQMMNGGTAGHIQDDENGQIKEIQ